MLKSYFQKAQYAILLSGTPALSRPIELLKQVEFTCSFWLNTMYMSKYLVFMSVEFSLNFAVGSIISKCV